MAGWSRNQLINLALVWLRIDPYSSFSGCCGRWCWLLPVSTRILETSRSPITRSMTSGSNDDYRFRRFFFVDCDRVSGEVTGWRPAWLVRAWFGFLLVSLDGQDSVVAVLWSYNDMFTLRRLLSFPFSSCLFPRFSPDWFLLIVFSSGGFLSVFVGRSKSRI